MLRVYLSLLGFKTHVCFPIQYSRAQDFGWTLIKCTLPFA